MQFREVLRLLNLEDREKEAQCLVAGPLILKILYTKTWWKFTKGQKEKIEQIWKKHLQEHSLGFDIRMLSLKGITKTNEGIVLTVRPVMFSKFFASRYDCQGKRIAVSSGALDSGYPLPLSFGLVTRTVPTPDNPKGCIIAAIRGNTTFEAGKATFLPGGYIDFKNCKKWPVAEEPGDKRIIPLNGEIQREFAKQLPGINYKGEPRLLGIIQSLKDSCQPLIAGWTEIPFTAKEVMARCYDRVGGEISEIICVPNDIDSLREFAQKHALCIHDVYKIALYLADATK